MPACLAAADEYIHRVAVIAHSPPLSYTDQDGRLTGFNVEIARELCTAMNVRCTLQPMPIEKIATCTIGMAWAYPSIKII
ncbi:MAG: transporter substrate-binding domain-containing protein [Rhodoferax sp.]|nr:transporter substrate-binding domain-containing protein [Rhodoferax sp.]